MRYAVAYESVFRTVQGEGALLGVPMTFIRLAGCSVGCPGCDTNYKLAKRLTVQEIRELVGQYPTDWVWITGGEPTDQNLHELLDCLSEYQVALATSGIRENVYGAKVDFLSVSPHERVVPVVELFRWIDPAFG